MVTREEALEFINGLIIENHGTIATEDTMVRDIDIDSFGFAVFFLELDEKYGSFSETDRRNGSYRDKSIKEIIDKVIKCL